MFALVKLVSSGLTIAVNVTHVIKMTPSGITDSIVDLDSGASNITVHGTPSALAADFNLALVSSGAPSSQGSSPIND